MPGNVVVWLKAIRTHLDNKIAAPPLTAAGLEDFAGCTIATRSDGRAELLETTGIKSRSKIQCKKGNWISGVFYLGFE
jgi:hypothetical protein